MVLPFFCTSLTFKRSYRVFVSDFVAVFGYILTCRKIFYHIDIFLPCSSRMHWGFWSNLQIFSLEQVVKLMCGIDSRYIRRLLFC